MKRFLYTVLSTKKKQDRRIVYCNTKIIWKKSMDGFHNKEEVGATVVNVQIIPDNTGGCS